MASSNCAGLSRLDKSRLPQSPCVERLSTRPIPPPAYMNCDKSSDVCEHCESPLKEATWVYRDGYSYHLECHKCYVCDALDLENAETFKGVIFCEGCATRIFRGRSRNTWQRPPADGHTRKTLPRMFSEYSARDNVWRGLDYGDRRTVSHYRPPLPLSDCQPAFKKSLNTIKGNVETITYRNPTTADLEYLKDTIEKTVSKVVKTTIQNVLSEMGTNKSPKGFSPDSNHINGTNIDKNTSRNTLEQFMITPDTSKEEESISNLDKPMARSIAKDIPIVKKSKATIDLKEAVSQKNTENTYEAVSRKSPVETMHNFIDSTKYRTGSQGYDQMQNVLRKDITPTQTELKMPELENIMSRFNGILKSKSVNHPMVDREMQSIHDIETNRYIKVNKNNNNIHRFCHHSTDECKFSKRFSSKARNIFTSPDKRNSKKCVICKPAKSRHIIKRNLPFIRRYKWTSKKANKNILRKHKDCSDARIAELGISTEITHMGLINHNHRTKSSVSTIFCFIPNQASKESHGSSSSFSDSAHQLHFLDRRIGSLFKIPLTLFKKNILERSSLVEAAIKDDEHYERLNLMPYLRSLFTEEVPRHQGRGFRPLYKSINRRKSRIHRLGWVPVPSKAKNMTIRCPHYERSHSYRCMRRQAMRLAGPNREELAKIRAHIKSFFTNSPPAVCDRDKTNKNQPKRTRNNPARATTDLLKMELCKFRES
ncbi:uncharacterized protein LOC105392380 [Plutella xylostella]|uniref:uncharacterized protein LOC105392380 n=1 Tax=Plutella xylostella TaxID=51655 RepID=UPI0020323041|nr:uncharacterized protein LOC105392380 [Plutella xylostella]